MPVPTSAVTQLKAIGENRVTAPASSPRSFRIGGCAAQRQRQRRQAAEPDGHRQ